jgi:hypothetical protein
MRAVATALSQTQFLLHHTEMEIRDAVAEDAPAACQVLRRSISELCVADHGNDPAILAKWLLNKTPDIVASWIALPVQAPGKFRLAPPADLSFCYPRRAGIDAGLPFQGT